MVKRRNRELIIYNDIHVMPIRVYQRVLDSGDLSHLVVSGEAKKPKLVSTWESINLQIIELKLKDPQFQADIAIKKDLLVSLIQTHLANKTARSRVLLNKLRNAEKKDLDTPAFNFLDSMYKMSRYMGTHLPGNTFTVAEYLTYQDNISKEVAQKDK